MVDIFPMRRYVDMNGCMSTQAPKMSPKNVYFLCLIKIDEFENPINFIPKKELSKQFLSVLEEEWGKKEILAGFYRTNKLRCQ